MMILMLKSFEDCNSLFIEGIISLTHIDTSWWQ